MDPDYSYLKNTLLANVINYKQLKEDNIVVMHAPEELYDIAFVIPLRGRLDFLKPMYHSFCKAVEKSGLKVSLTVAEHSTMPEHSHFCKKNKINYIWIKSVDAEPFNKCLAMNMAALFTSKSKYILFHDLDCLVQSDFFSNLIYNVFKKNCEAIQCFHGRRVLYLNDELTNKVINEEIDVDTFKLGMPGVSLPYAIGAPGGSICVSRDLFFEVGGYDPELFHSNAPEDIFFWNKIDAVSKMEICDNPQIEIFHMNHPVTYYDNPQLQEMLNLKESFVAATPEQKKEFLLLKSKILKKI